MHCKQLVFDFDGTIARIFTNFDRKETLAKLKNTCNNFRLEFTSDNDMFDVFSMAKYLDDKYKKEYLSQVNEIIVKAELEAIKTSIMIEGLYEFIEKYQETSLPLYIVSNNSEECISYFFQKNFSNISLKIIGRPWDHPELMKPNTFLLKKLCEETGFKKDDIIYIGDNPRDCKCALEFGCDFIALVPTEKKKERMIQFYPDVKIATNFYQLLELVPTI